MKQLGNKTSILNLQVSVVFNQAAVYSSVKCICDGSALKDEAKPAC